MNPFGPEEKTVMAFYRNRQAQFTQLADELQVPMLGLQVHKELAHLIGQDNVSLLESIARIGCYGDTKEMSRARTALAAEMKKHGHLPQRGKRTGAGLKEMVEDLTPVLRYFGVPPSLSETGPLVTALRFICEGMGVPGDPRNELRKLERLAKSSATLDGQAIREAVKNGLASLKISPPS
ncbi:hypothetical protein [Rhodoferax sp. TS-BS-61-7]|uniref:hypothetical protein n=1 Tax=Rhodoferax sp. TS-BS-61-7 TaxID=2094194 RepID=UPI000CF631E8|nr:hypothetical protein [Rhodoferax sp. TS-BS-61-7]PQA78928.1 hypothetical protein C5F53_02890 [Rhodoferax sp. TS-BS-61-7]